MEDQREKFEAWSKSHLNKLDLSVKNLAPWPYVDETTLWAWAAWQAAWAAKPQLPDCSEMFQRGK